jgi:N-acetylneuraminic acid mutarotase
MLSKRRSLAVILIFLALNIMVFDGSARAQSATLGEWSEKTPMPTARKEISNATVFLDGKIYVIGGVSGNGSMVSLVEAYDPETDTWEARASLPITVWRTIAAAADGKLFVFGGYQSLAGFPFSPTNRVFEYDPAP